MKRMKFGRISRANGKEIEAFKHIDDYEVAIEITRDISLQENLEASTDANSDVFIIYNEGFGDNVKGSYAIFEVFQLVALWVDKKHKSEVLKLLKAINEVANAIDRSAYEVMNKTIEDLQTRLDITTKENTKLKAQMIDDNSPFSMKYKSWIYALEINEEYFQLRFMRNKPSKDVKYLDLREYTNANDVLTEFRYYGKRLGYYYKYREKNVCKRDDIATVFQMLDEIKANTFDLYKYKSLPTLITDEIEHLKAKDTTAQITGKIFELEYCRDNNYIPWKLQQPMLLHKYNEERRDKGIDFVDIIGDKVTAVGQIKVRGCGKINETEIRKFITKASSEKYKDCKRILVTKDCLKLSNKLLKLLVKENVKLVML